MLFFRIEGNLVNRNEETDEKTAALTFQLKSEKFFNESKQNSYVFVAKECTGLFVAGLITKEDKPPLEIAEAFLLESGLEAENIIITEITLREITMMLHNADRKDYISDDDYVLFNFGLKDYYRRRDIAFTERMISADGCSRSSLIKEAGEQLWDQTLRPEIERIYKGAKVSSAVGHPVHYILSSDNRKKREKASELLLRALRDNNRLKSGRIAKIHSFEEINAVKEVYNEWSGGTIIIICKEEEDSECVYNRGSVGEITELCDVAKKYRNSVLTLFWLPGSDNRMKNVIMECMGSVPMIELSENAISSSEAKSYLRRKAKKHGVTADKKLYSIVKEEGSVYNAAELDREFTEWLGGRLQRSVYPQYSNIRTACVQAKKLSETSNSLAELNSMIGLEEAKGVINRALSYYKAQRMFAEKGFDSGTPAMHMVFTGNPGTAKTTVARLFAQIMKENGILSEGELVEVGRSDLVGKYVG